MESPLAILRPEGRGPASYLGLGVRGLGRPLLDWTGATGLTGALDPDQAEPLDAGRAFGPTGEEGWSGRFDGGGSRDWELEWSGSYGERLELRTKSVWEPTVAGGKLRVRKTRAEDRSSSSWGSFGCELRGVRLRAEGRPSSSCRRSSASWGLGVQAAGFFLRE
ncbi:hypothetical protein CRG98_004524 [Punica granatum]|uniref:Uncharacterized protein n=1 Tax=Punica granatum TaxID=22663 RepID=A0A2I0L349_PUNGR|nr:hypothetical protein CRG98_004524 [Punica granatum]